MPWNNFLFMFSLCDLLSFVSLLARKHWVSFQWMFVPRMQETLLGSNSAANGAWLSCDIGSEPHYSSANPVTTLAPGLILDIAEFPAARHTLASCWQLWYEQGELPGRMGCVCFLSAPLWFHSLPRQPRADLMLAGGNTQMCHFFYSIHAKNVFLKKRPVDIERFVGVQKQQEFFISVCRAALRWQIEMEAIHLFSQTDA